MKTNFVAGWFNPDPSHYKAVERGFRDACRAAGAYATNDWENRALSFLTELTGKHAIRTLRDPRMAFLHDDKRWT